MHFTFPLWLRVFPPQIFLADTHPTTKNPSILKLQPTTFLLVAHYSFTDGKFSKLEAQ